MDSDPSDDSPRESYFDFPIEQKLEWEPSEARKVEPVLKPVAAPKEMPHFTPEEERQIEINLEVKRRWLRENAHEELVMEPDFETDPEILVSFEGTYPAAKKHILSFFMTARKNIGLGLAAIVALWLVVLFVADSFFNVEQGSEASVNIGLICFGLTLIIIATVYFMEIKNFMLWRKWSLEVTLVQVRIDRDKSFLGRFDEEHKSLRRISIESVDVKRSRWLFFIDAWTVSFNAPIIEDGDFRGMTFIKRGKKLKELFTPPEG